MNRWQEIALGSKCDVFSGFPFKSDGFSSDEQDIPLVKGENIGQGEILWDISKRWPRDDLPDLERYRLLPGDVVLAMDRPWVPAGLKFARVREADPEALLVQRVARLRARQGLDQGFLGHVVAAPQFVEYIKNIARGVGVPHISGQQIADFRFRLPPLEDQRRIASTLAAYDDLIENNRRRMALLEDAARQLYREWFVRLRFPGHEHTAIHNGVPQGWRRQYLQDCAVFSSGGTPSKSRAEFWDGDIPWASSGELTSFHVRRTSLQVTQDAVESGSKLVPAGTILAVVRGMSLAKEFRISLVSVPMAFNQDLKAIAAGPDVDGLLLFHTLDDQREAIRDRAGEASHGTKKLDTAVLSKIPVLVPPSRLQQSFREIVAPLHDQWDVLEQQSLQLRAARDLLLPRLMSGEIAV